MNVANGAPNAASAISIEVRRSPTLQPHQSRRKSRNTITFLLHPHDHRRLRAWYHRVAISGACATDACDSCRGRLKRHEYRDIEHGKTEGDGQETSIDLAKDSIEALQGTTGHRNTVGCGGVVRLTTEMSYTISVERPS